MCIEHFTVFSFKYHNLCVFRSYNRAGSRLITHFHCWTDTGRLLKDTDDLISLLLLNGLILPAIYLSVRGSESHSSRRISAASSSAKIVVR